MVSQKTTRFVDSGHEDPNRRLQSISNHCFVQEGPRTQALQQGLLNKPFGGRSSKYFTLLQPICLPHLKRWTLRPNSDATRVFNTFLVHL